MHKCSKNHFISDSNLFVTSSMRNYIIFLLRINGQIFNKKNEKYTYD
ncbi:hypothetical protein M153_11600019618 [Pseudoloma neurophilia]|uniref:Uncharacterized protein n=1 Tax=Pseudoloma neurophilia TaxID=146866 RepID=A0A0R0M013_9MICR|nr:hypothetical protein M153_11600019618 [Pseudoloma neurophilia]